MQQNHKNLIQIAALVAVTAVGVFWIVNYKSNVPIKQSNINSGFNELLSNKLTISNVGAESFGDLKKFAQVVETKNSGDGGNSANTVVATNKVGSNSPQSEIYSGTAVATSSAGNATGFGMGVGGGVPDSKMIAPGEPYPIPQNFSFVYKGKPLEELNLLSENQSVMKRKLPQQISGFVNQIAGFLSFGLVDINKFTDTKLWNISFYEDHEFGYSFYGDFQNGTVNISQNYEKWPQPKYGCEKDYCGNLPQLTENQLPTNDEAIAIASKFLADYGISLDGYGAPVVQDFWRNEIIPLGQVRYIPEQVQVIYPLELEGKQIYDEGNNVYGLTVMVDARTKRVVNVYELNSKQYEKSEYAGETDFKKILKIAEAGGFRNYLYQDPNAKTVKLELETPQVQLIKMWYYDESKKFNGELYVPSLVFPIKNAQESKYWQKSLYVPLVKDILDAEQSKPMPVDLEKQYESR